MGSDRGVAVNKIERDRVMMQATEEDRLVFRRIISQVQAEVKALNCTSATRQSLLAARAQDASTTLKAQLEAVIARDRQGPTEGRVPPDFDLKMLGSPEQVQLSSFPGRSPVALVFGSYT